MEQESVEQLAWELDRIKIIIESSRKGDIMRAINVNLLALYVQCPELEAFVQNNLEPIKAAIQRVDSSTTILQSSVKTSLARCEKKIDRLEGAIRSGRTGQKISKKLSDNMIKVVGELSTIMVANDYLIRKNVVGYGEHTHRIGLLHTRVMQMIPAFDRKLWSCVLPATISGVCVEVGTSCQNMRREMMNAMTACMLLDAEQAQVGTTDDVPPATTTEGGEMDEAAEAAFQAFGMLWDSLVDNKKHDKPFDITWASVSKDIISYFKDDAKFGEMLDEWDDAVKTGFADAFLLMKKSEICLYIANTSREIMEDECDPNDPLNNAITDGLDDMIEQISGLISYHGYSYGDDLMWE